MTKQIRFNPSGNLPKIELGGEEYFSTVETAKKLGLCAAAFYVAKKKFGLEGTRVGRRRYYSQTELIEKIFNRKRNDE